MEIADAPAMTPALPSSRRYPCGTEATGTNLPPDHCPIHGFECGIEKAWAGEILEGTRRFLRMLTEAWKRGRQ